MTGQQPPPEAAESASSASVDASIAKQLATYGLDSEYGFLDVDPPPRETLVDLHPDFAPWETLLSQLQAFLLVRQLRRHVETALPPFPISALPPFEHATRAELAAWKRAYLLLAFIAHGYVWSKNEAASRWLPHVLATPWKRVSTQLGLPPVSTYAASVLWNLHIVDPAQPWSLDNMGIMHSFTGMDEAWFYLISAGIEARGGRAPRLILEAQQAAARDDGTAVTARLAQLADLITALGAMLGRMIESNDPHIFYHRTRVYLAGWEGSLELPDGLFYELSPAERGAPSREDPRVCTYQTADGVVRYGRWLKAAGSSAGQSALMQALDVALDVRHYPTRDDTLSFRPDELPLGGADAQAVPDILPQDLATPAQESRTPDDARRLGPLPTPEPPSAGAAPTASRDRAGDDARAGEVPGSPATPSRRPVNHIAEMRRYMPGQHRKFLAFLESQTSLRAYVLQRVAASAAAAASGQASAEADATAALVNAYNAAVRAMTAFRSAHIRMVSAYIIVQATRKPPAGVPAGAGDGGTGGTSAEIRQRRVQQSLAAKGTGGTKIIPFLKQARDETQEREIKALPTAPTATPPAQSS